MWPTITTLQLQYIYSNNIVPNNVRLVILACLRYLIDVIEMSNAADVEYIVISDDDDDDIIIISSDEEYW